MPGGSDAATYLPDASLTTVRSVPVALLRIASETPGMAAPDWSGTAPSSVAVDCARAVAATNVRINARRIDLIHSPSKWRQVTERGSGDSKVVLPVTRRRKPRVVRAFNAGVQKVESDISFGRLKLWRFVADRPVCRFFGSSTGRDPPVASVKIRFYLLTGAVEGEYIRARRNNSPFSHDQTNRHPSHQPRKPDHGHPASSSSGDSGG